MESGQVSAKPHITKEESKILLSFIESSKFINNKSTKATTNQMKTEEWERITDQFNAVVPTCHRTPHQLRLKWENLKKSSRKRNNIRMSNIKTGGSYYIPPDEVLDRVTALLDKTVDGLTVDDTDLEIEDCASTNVVIESNLASEIQTWTSEDSSSFLEGRAFELNEAEDTEECSATKRLNEAEDTEECSATKRLNEADDTEECSATKRKKFLSTPRASGSKRELLSKDDENRSARNQALANYYTVKTKLLEANLENVLLENQKLKLEIKKLQNR